MFLVLLIENEQLFVHSLPELPLDCFGEFLVHKSLAAHFMDEFVTLIGEIF